MLQLRATRNGNAHRVTQRLELDDVQIGSMFVTDEVVKAVCGPAPGRVPTVALDGRRLQEPFEIAELRIAADQLTRWQRTRLLWAPVLRRVRVRLERPEHARTKVVVRRRWPR